MATPETLNVILKLSTGDYKREAREAATATGQIASSAKSASGPVDSLARSGTGLANAYKGFVAAAAGAAIVKFAADSVSAASNLDESINAVNKTFGTAADTIESFGQVSAQAVGLSTREFNQLATVTGSMLTNLGFNADAAATETVRLTQRASDMASVFNTDVGTALAAVNSALKGEANPIEQFGVKLNDAAVRARAVELGLAETTAAVDANGKATATLSLIYEQTNKTAGDFAQTSDGLANSQRRAAAAMENAQARLGKAVTPALANLMDRFAEGVERVAVAFGDKAAKNALVFNEAMKELSDEIAAGTAGTDDLANAILHMALNAELTSAEVETLTTQAGLTADSFAAFATDMVVQAEAMGLPIEVIDELKTALYGVAPAIDNLEPPLLEGTEAIQKYGTAASKAAVHARAVASAQRAITQALLEAVNPAVAAASAIGRLNDAQAKVDELAADGATGTREFATAMIELAVAKGEAQAALDSFDASGASGAASALARIWDVPIEQAFEYLELLGLIDDRVVTTTVITTFVNRGDLATGDGSGRTYPGGKQHGGPVWSGRPYIVGEAGPELFIPQRSGMILPNSRMSELGSMSWGGGNMTTINVESPMRDFRTDLQYATIVASVTNMVEQV